MLDQGRVQMLHARAGTWRTVGYGGKMSTSSLPSPLRHFLAQLDELRSGDSLDMDQVGRLLVGLAADEEYFGPLIAEMPAETPGGSGWSSPNGVPAWCCSTGQRG